MSYRLIAVLAFGALAAACTATETKTVVVPQPVAAADDSCSAYGYVPGTRDYSICVDREAAARRRGRMAADYAQAAIVADSQEACASYGLVRGTDRFDRCVTREINYRRPA
jgi:hypothetical protein